MVRSLDPQGCEGCRGVRQPAEIEAERRVLAGVIEALSPQLLHHDRQ